MSMKRLERLRDVIANVFPERHIYVRSEGETRAFVLSTNNQTAIAGIIAACGLWLGVSTAALMVDTFVPSSSDKELAQMQAKSERWVADREARLNSAVAQLDAANGSIGSLAATVEKRHAALAMLLTQAKNEPGLAKAVAPALQLASSAPQAVSPTRRIEIVRTNQERLIDAADNFARGRAERLRLAFRLAGLSPSDFSSAASSLGGPLIDAKDPRALAAILDVDEPFAQRIQHAATNLSEAEAMTRAAAKLPLAKPTDERSRSSGFGVRFDPFNGRPAFHSGLDFTGGICFPIYSTEPGSIPFTGVRPRDCNTIPIDHGSGFKTRYAHLSGISVSIGERVAVGERIGAMGSTGRSTGPHIHYEVWVNGRAQNPDRFLKAGEYVL